jgi:N-acetylglucosamine malate deacetylase 1
MLGDSFLAEQRLLVVAPHPDDEAIGCAGTIARVKALGGQAYVMIASAGGITQHGRGAGGQGREFVSGEQRMAEFEDVMSYLKVDGHEVLLGDDASHERLDAEVASADLVILLQDHSAYDLDRISRDARLVLDTRGRTEGAHIEVL